MHCEILPLDSFEVIASDWEKLADRYRNAPFMGVDFVRALVDVFATGSERLVRVTSGKDVVAIGIFCRRRGMWETFQPSQIPIGCLVARQDLAWADLLSAIGAAMPGLTLGVAASQQDPLFSVRPPDDASVTTLDYIATAAIDVAGTFEEYWNARGKNLRQNLRKQRRKLADDGVALELEIIRSAAEVESAISDYARLESAGWKASGGTAITVGTDQGRFYRQMLEQHCARGRGAIYRYRFADRVVVVDLCIESNDTLVILKTTYDESIRAYSPAALMREEAFRQIWEGARIRRIEFYGPMKEWHSRWTEQARTLYHVNWYRWPRLMRLVTKYSQQLRSRRGVGAPLKTKRTERV